MAIRKRARPNVISLRGATLPGTCEPDPDVCRKIDELRDKARAGQVYGLAYVLVSDQDVATGWVGRADSNLMMAGAALLNYRITKAVDGE